MVNEPTKNAPSGYEPSEEEIKMFMKVHKLDYYNAREQLRNIAYGGHPPNGFKSWGDYWKSY